MRSYKIAILKFPSTSAGYHVDTNLSFQEFPESSLCIGFSIVFGDSFLFSPGFTNVEHVVKLDIGLSVSSMILFNSRLPPTLQDPLNGSRGHHSLLRYRRLPQRHERKGAPRDQSLQRHKPDGHTHPSCSQTPVWRRRTHHEHRDLRYPRVQLRGDERVSPEPEDRHMRVHRDGPLVSSFHSCLLLFDRIEPLGREQRFFFSSSSSARARSAIMSILP